LQAGLDRGHEKSWPWDRDHVAMVGYRFRGESGLIVAVQVRSCGQIPYRFNETMGLIWAARLRSNGWDIAIPLQPVRFAKDPSGILENNLLSICFEELLRISPVLFKTNHRFSSNYVRSTDSLGKFRIKRGNNF
jgi:hypothetical protein